MVIVTIHSSIEVFQNEEFVFQREIDWIVIDNSVQKFCRNVTEIWHLNDGLCDAVTSPFSNVE